MFRNFARFFTSLTLLILSVSLSGCFSTKPLIAFDYLLPSAEEQEIPDIQETDDPDMVLVDSEPAAALVQELVALSESGQWGEEITEPEPEPVAEAPPLYDFPVVMNKQVEMYLNLFQGRQRKNFHRWLERSGKYLPMMEKELVKAGLPKDLVYLSMIESGYNQRAYSRARAVGLWQFMRATGKQYKLKIDHQVDERRDAQKSTVAAVRFLSDLYAEFNDWHLAVAAYNAGPGKIRSGLRRNKVDNFWDLAKHNHLRLETKRYVPKLIAAIIIAREPEKYGFHNIAYASPLKYESLNVGPGMTLEAIALISGSNTKTIKELNQELRKAKTPTNRASYSVKIPAGTSVLAKNNMERLHGYVSTGYKTHKIQGGETLASICRKYDINTTTLLKVNNLRSGKLKRGTNLRIPYSTIKYQLLPAGTTPQQFAANSDNLILHRIKNGETISKIAKKYCIPQDMIVQWNGLSSVHKIRAGQQLALFIENTSQKSAPKPNRDKPVISAVKKKRMGESVVRHQEKQDKGVPVLVAQKKRKAPKSAAQPAYSWYKVRSGDSLWTISRRFNTSASQIKKLNNLKSNIIRPGSRLKVKKV